MKPPTLTEGKLQDQGQIDQDLEEWFSPRGIQTNQGFFYKEDKKEYTQIEGLDSEGATISNQSPEGVIYTTVVVKWSEKAEELGGRICAPFCRELYKEYYGSIVP